MGWIIPRLHAWTARSFRSSQRAIALIDMDKLSVRLRTFAAKSQKLCSSRLVHHWA